MNDRRPAPTEKPVPPPPVVVRSSNAKCVVCGEPATASLSGEQLCWVCRRLKISAWREVDQQAPSQD